MYVHHSIHSKLVCCFLIAELQVCSLLRWQVGWLLCFGAQHMHDSKPEVSRTAETAAGPHCSRHKQGGGRPGHPVRVTRCGAARHLPLLSTLHFLCALGSSTDKSVRRGMGERCVLCMYVENHPVIGEQDGGSAATTRPFPSLVTQHLWLRTHLEWDDRTEPTLSDNATTRWAHLELPDDPVVIVECPQQTSR